ncbi:putative DNA repair protein RAD54 [Balamuthia mandrillaris]
MAKAIQRKAEARFRSLEQRRSNWSAEDEAVEDDMGGKKKWRKHDKSTNTKYQRGKEAFVKKTKTGGGRRSKGREGGYEMEAEIGGEGGRKMREPITREDRASQKYLQTKAYMLSDLMSSAKKGQVERCNRIFEEMKAKHIKPDTFIFDQLLIAHSHHGRVKQALKLYNSLKKHGNHPSIFTFNILFNTFANFEPPASFSLLHQKSTRDDGDDEEQEGDNEVGSTHNSKYLDRIRWLKEEEMKRYNVRPNIETYNCLLKAYMTHSYYGGEREVRSGRGALANVLSTLAEMREQGLAPNVSTYTFLMGAIVPSSSFSSPFRYRRFSDEDVAQLRYELQRCNDSAKERQQNKQKNKSRKKTDAEGAGEGEEGKEEEKEAQIEERLSNLKPTSSSSVEQMFELWEEMKRNVTPDLRSYNQLMKACSDSHKTEEQLITFEVYKQMIQAAKASSPPSSFFATGRKQREAAQKQPPFPDVRTFDILFTTCNKLKAYQMARELFETQLVPALGLRHAYRQWKQQQQRVSLMPKNNHGEEEAQEEEEQDESYNNDEKHEKDSSSSFPTFPYYKTGTTATMKVDEMMFVKVLKACCMDSPEFVENVLYVMRRKKVGRHDKRTLETLIQVYGRAKQVDRVRSLYQEMKKTTLIGMSNDPSQKMNLKSYTIALTACRDCGDTALAFQVAQDMLRLGGHEVVSTMDKVFARLLLASLKETQMKALLSSSALEEEEGDEQEEKSKQPVIALPEPQRELLRRVIEQEKDRRFWRKKRKKENMRMKWKGLGRIEGEDDEEEEGEHEDDGQGNEVTGFEGSKREESDIEDEEEEDEEDEEDEEVQQRRRKVPESKKQQRNAKIAAVKAMYQRKPN